MPLSAGDKLGPYEILSLIGEGGMGEVYKARDTRLDRIVAIKIGIEQFSERFEREARAVAVLNHPHICTLHDIYTPKDAPNCLVMEYIEGTPLKGPLPLAQALKYGSQICDALDAAHRKGITHRDLKPGNVLVTKSGIKLLDFGLAKIGASAAKPMNDATLTMALTGKNEIVGTLFYMSPEQLHEQATGKEVDSLSDIFSFGLVLYEMLTGKRAFEGPSPASIIAAILERPAPSIQAVAPPALEHLLQRCLKKDPEERWQSARDIKAELDWIASDPAATAIQAPAAPGRSPRWLWAGAGVFLIAAATLGALHFSERPAAQPVVRFNVAPPMGGFFAGATPRLSISPDGMQLAVQVSTEQGNRQLWVRRLDSVEFRPISGTEAADVAPIWSTDSRSIAFFANNKLNRVDAAGGPVQVLCAAPANDQGGSWSSDGVILFSGRNPVTPITRIAASGGVPAPILKLADGEIQRFPRFLPDERHFMYFASFPDSSRDGVFVSSLDGMPPKRLLTSRFMADYADGYLLYRVDRALMARPFDVSKLEFTGDAVLVAPTVGILANNGRVGFSVSRNGYLAYAEDAGGETSHLVWFDRSGKQLEEVGTDADGEPRLSPDGKQAAYTRSDGGTTQLWLIDFARGIPSRFTLKEENARYPVWSPDGKEIVFAAGERPQETALYRKSVSGLRESEMLLKVPEDGAPMDLSPDGRLLLYLTGPLGNRDIYGLPFAAPAPAKPEPIPVQVGPSSDTTPRFSPDGHWIAYSTNESGTNQVNVRSFPGQERKVQISAGDGTEPEWRRDGKELYYLALNQREGVRNLMAVPIKSLRPFEVGTPAKLFAVPAFATFPTSSHYAPTADGSKFLFVGSSSQAQAQSITVVQNWTATLRRK